MANWRWLDLRLAAAIHSEQISEHGGLEGLRDEGLLNSALSRPQNLAGYGEPDIADLAAAYAWGIARNHPFIDGNKRVSLILCETFLVLNGYKLEADDLTLTMTFLDLAAGKIEETDLAAWLRARLSRQRP
jgi:death on curing protein